METLQRWIFLNMNILTQMWHHANGFEAVTGAGGVGGWAANAQLMWPGMSSQHHGNEGMGTRGRKITLKMRGKVYFSIPWNHSVSSCIYTDFFKIPEAFCGIMDHRCDQCQILFTSGTILTSLQNCKWDYITATPCFLLSLCCHSTLKLGLEFFFLSTKFPPRHQK